MISQNKSSLSRKKYWHWIFIKLGKYWVSLEQHKHGEHLREVNSTLGDQTINDKVKQRDEDKNQKGI